MTMREPPSGPEEPETVEWEDEHERLPELNMEWLGLIDAWVARSEGFDVAQRETAEGRQIVIVTSDGERPVPPYTRPEEFARPIINREGIELQSYIDSGVPCTALATIACPDIEVTPAVGYTELEAAMVCYVSMKFGNAALDGASPAMG